MSRRSAPLLRTPPTDRLSVRVPPAGAPASSRTPPPPTAWQRWLEGLQPDAPPMPPPAIRPPAPAASPSAAPSAAPPLAHRQAGATPTPAHETPAGAPAAGPSGAAPDAPWTDHLPADVRSALWQADRLAPAPVRSVPTGFPALDRQLPGGGWPRAGLIELLLSTPACGELPLLAPALAAVAREGRELLFVAPPWMPHAPAWQALGLPLQRLCWVRPSRAADGAWAAEQALRSGAFGWVLWWSDGPTDATVLRRLHLAAAGGGTPLTALRPWSEVGRASPAPLRLGCAPLPGRRLGVRILKRRGPAAWVPLQLPLPEPAGMRWPTAAPHDPRPSDAPAPMRPVHGAARLAPAP